MKNIKNTIATLLFLLIGITSVQAQNSDDIFTLTYNMSVPSSGVNNYITDASFRGLTLDYRHFLNDNVSVGVSMSYNLFNQSMGYQTYENNSAAISGEEFRYNNNFSTLATVHYYPTLNSNVKPYAGVGIGASGNYYTDMLGGVSISDQYWSFAIAPEVGVMIPIPNTNFALNTNVKYNYQAPAKGYNASGYWGFNIGFTVDL